MEKTHRASPIAKLLYLLSFTMLLLPLQLNGLFLVLIHKLEPQHVRVQNRDPFDQPAGDPIVIALEADGIWKYAVWHLFWRYAPKKYSVF